MNGAEANVPLTALPGDAVVAETPTCKKLQDGLVALSLANLCLLRTSLRLLYSENKGYFEEVGVTLGKLLALTLNLALVGMILWLGLRAWRRWRGRWPSTILEFGLFLVLLVPLDFCRTNILDISDYQLAVFFTRPWVAAGLLAMAGFVAWQHRRVARVMTIGVGIFFPLMLFALARMAFVAVHLAEAPPAPNPGGTAALLPPRENQPRVLWVIFDETDQRLAFEERPVGVDLPQFDRLRSESLYATNAVPPGPSTFFSMPSLIAGRRFSDVEVESRSELKVTDAETGVSKEWSELPNLFSSARELGFNGAVVGWYHPYDRLLGRNLAFCRWFASPTERKRSQHVDALMERQLLRCCAEMFYGRKLFAELCQESLHESLSVVTNAKYGVTLLHLPPPHRPGVYEPKTGAFTIWGMPKKNAYFNNLALADQYLGELRAAMERANLWVKSWVIMSADHSWRESGLYDGRRDLRVPFLVKAAGKSEHMTCAQRLNTVLTHDLILAILSGKVTSQQEAVSWLAEHGSAEPPVDGGHLD